MSALSIFLSVAAAIKWIQLNSDFHNIEAAHSQLAARNPALSKNDLITPITNFYERRQNPN